MTTITLKGTPVNTVGELPRAGAAPAFTLTGGDLGDIQLSDFAGKKLILNVFPSIDTPTCATSVRTFNVKASSLENTVVLCVAADLPFAMGRFCGAEGIADVQVASSFRSSFGEDYGLTIADSKLAGLLSRAVVVINEAGEVVYSEQVAEIAQEPNYEAALAAL